MKPEIKDEWVAALRSGCYLQCGGVLKMPTAHGCFHCALGVLMELAIEHGVIEDYDETSEVPEEVSEWSGLQPHEMRIAVYKNDILTWPFEEIALHIEENF